MKKPKAPPKPRCNYPGCTTMAEGFFCKTHFAPIPQELKRAIRNAWRECKDTPDKQRPIEKRWLFQSAIQTVQRSMEAPGAAAFIHTNLAVDCPKVV